MHNDSPISDTIERLERAEQLKLMGKHTEAMDILETLLIEDPENVSALEEIADNELSLEQYERAKVAAERVIKLDAESYTGHYILGFLASIEQRWDDAVESLRTANTVKPNNAEILRCLGWALFNADQKAQGIVTLERALNLDTENPLTLCDLGVSYLKTRNFKKSKMLFSRALDLDPQNPKAKECMKAVERLQEAMKENQ